MKNKIIVVGNIFDTTNKTHASGRVYSGGGIAPTIGASHFGMEKYILEKQIVAMRGRNSDNPSLRTKGLSTEQRLEKNSEGICNCITSVQKDNLVMEKEMIQIKQATKDGYIECEVGGGGRPKFP